MSQEHPQSESGATPLLPPLFTAVARNSDGITGESRIDNGLTVTVASPTAADRGTATNPEELLALSWVTCLNAAARVVAGPGIEVEASAEISLHPRAEVGFEFSGKAELRFVGVPLAEATALAEAAHERCPVSRMLNGRSSVTVSAVA